MYEWLLNNKELISVYSSLATIFGSIAVPFILFWWAKSSEKKKEKREEARIERDKKEQSRKEEQQYLINYIEKYLYSSYNDYYNLESIPTPEKEIEKMKLILETKFRKLSPLNVIVQQLSYNYLADFFNVFTEVVGQAISYKWKNQTNFIEFYCDILESMPMLVFLILTEKEQYKRMKSFFFSNFISPSSDEAKNIILFALEKNKKEEK